jgi:hypothetical protein
MCLIEFLFLITIGAAPEQGAELAVRLQQQGHHAAAAALYDLLETRKPMRPEFYLNQGHAHFLAGDLPQAILAYRRAERMSMYFDVRSCLADARSRVIASPGVGAEWPDLAIEAGMVGYILYVLAWGLLARSPRRGRLRGLMCVCFVLSFGLLGYYLYASWYAPPVAVISADAVMLRKGNGDSYAPVELAGAPVQLNRGVEARALAGRRNGWVQIKLRSGIVGWVPRTSLLLDCQSDPT